VRTKKCVQAGATTGGVIPPLPKQLFVNRNRYIGHEPIIRGHSSCVNSQYLLLLTIKMCHVNVSHMKSITIRKLRHDTSTVLEWVAQGESVEVCRRNRAVAMLTPLRTEGQIERPDFRSRLRDIYGDKVLPATGTELVNQSRGER
jgi:antitoxin (DNA-binding transcriptional repressor) of toxin-antitoxin stability system